MKKLTGIIMASNKKEAIERASANYGNRWLYVRPYKYSKGKGNNFYEFAIIK